ncbi:hypothetical protein [Bacillus cereus]|uniref:hypothetical protein n=1 Tax=Bacillus cereus TaxID=1396 RepID=UPI000B4BBD54|nr:hypothetical protein [Bacillus cereus]
MEKVNQYLDKMGLVPLTKKNDEDVKKRIIKDVKKLIGPKDEAKLKSDLVEYYFYEIGSLRLEGWEKQFTFFGLTIRQKEMLGEIFNTGLYYYDMVDDMIFYEIDFPTVDSAVRTIRKNIEGFYILFPGFELTFTFQSEDRNDVSVVQMLEAEMNKLLEKRNFLEDLKQVLYNEINLNYQQEA